MLTGKGQDAFWEELANSFRSPLRAVIYNDRHAVAIDDSNVYKMEIDHAGSLSIPDIKKRRNVAYFLDNNGIWGFYEGRSIILFHQESIFSVTLVSRCLKVLSARSVSKDDGSSFLEIYARTHGERNPLRINTSSGNMRYTNELVVGSALIARPTSAAERQVDIVCVGVCVLLAL